MSYEADMQTKIQTIIDRAIESDMHLHAFDGTVEDGFEGYGAATEANPLNDQILHVEPPGAANEGQATDQYGQVYTYDDLYFRIAVKPKEIYDKWRREIPAAFESWLQIPDPADIEPKLQAARDAAKKLGTTADAEGDGPSVRLVAGNQALAGDLGYLGDELGQFNGPTVDTFHREYVSRMPFVISAQWSAVCVLGSGLGGQKELWTRTRRDLLLIADDVADAMEAARGGGGGGFATLVKILGAVASGATIFITGGTAAPFVAGAATGLGILGTFLPEEGEGETEIPFGADEPDGVLAKVIEGLAKVSDDIAEDELKMRSAIAGARFEVFNNPDFDLSRPVGLLGETDVPDLVTADDGTEVKLSTLRTIANSVMPDIAGELEAGVGLLDTASGEGPWTRPSDIGMDARGYYWEWEQLYELLRVLVPDTAWEIREAGQHLSIAADILETNDADVRARLEEHTRAVQAGPEASALAVQGGTPVR